MMGRPFIRATLGLLLTLVLIHISKGQINADEEISELDGIQAFPIENSEVRIAREAKGKSHIRRKDNNQDKKKVNNGKRKSVKAGKKQRENQNKIEKNRKNYVKQKKKKMKSKKQSRKLKKKRNNKDRKSRRKKTGTKKGKNTPRQIKKISGKKKSDHQKKKSRTNRRKTIQNISKKNTFLKSGAKQACDETALCQKIKDYIKISNQLRKVRRIKKACDTMDKKAKKSVSEFEATAAALETAIDSSSSLQKVYRSRWRRAVESSDDVTVIKEKLKNCSISAKAKCQKSSVAPCQEEANLTKCETELQGWLNKFGPSKGSCLQASADCCACITALPDISEDCLAFDKKSTVAVNSKKKCTSGDEQGSFGNCRKLQIEAAEKGPTHAKNNCNKDKCHRHTCSKNSDCPSKCAGCNKNAGRCIDPSELVVTTASPQDKCHRHTCSKNPDCPSKCAGCNKNAGRCIDPTTTSPTGPQVESLDFKITNNLPINITWGEVIQDVCSNNVFGTISPGNSFSVGLGLCLIEKVTANYDGGSCNPYTADPATDYRTFKVQLSAGHGHTGYCYVCREDLCT